MLELISIIIALIIWMLAKGTGGDFLINCCMIGGLGFAIYALIAAIKWVLTLPKGNQPL